MWRLEFRNARELILQLCSAVILSQIRNPKNQSISLINENNYTVHVCRFYIELQTYENINIYYGPVLTKHPGNTACAVNNTFITRTARLPTLFSIFFFFFVLGVKVRSISCNIGPAERAISRNMDRSRMSGIGK